MSASYAYIATKVYFDCTEEVELPDDQTTTLGFFYLGLLNLVLDAYKLYESNGGCFGSSVY